MTSPADPASKPSGFTAGRLTPEQADQLAALFRPSWELDDAPFTGPGSLTGSELRALGGGGVMADVRAHAGFAPAAPAAHETNGTHAAPVAAPVPVAQEPSVVLDPGLTPAPPAAPHVAARTIMGMQAPVAPAPVSQAPAAPAFVAPAADAPRIPAARPSHRPEVPAFVIGPPTPRAIPTPFGQDTGSIEYPAKKKTGLFVGLGIAAVLVVGIGVWAMSSGGEKPTTTVPTAEATTTDKLSAVPPPPPPTQTAAATTTVAATPPPPPPATTAAPIPTTPPPAAAAPPPPAAVAAARPPTPAAAPRPAGGGGGGGGGAAAPPKPGKKGGQTIVRDVPF